MGNFQLRLKPQTVMIFFIFGFVMAVLSAFVNGWLFFRIGNIVRKTKSKIFDFKASLRKGWVWLRSMILAALVFLIFYVLILAFIFLTSYSKGAKPIVGVLILLLTIPIIFCLVTLLLLFFVSLIHLTPVISLENAGPITSMKLSISHFRKNKAHTFAIIGILILLAIPVMILSLVLSEILMGTIDNTKLVSYSLEHPLAYSLFTVVYSLPFNFFSILVYIFLAAAYNKKK